MKTHTHAHAAFTLVELSIVLVILGLLVGGVLTGQSLIHAAELRKVSNDFQRYQTAIYTFQDKYFALPGDMPNATAYWGVAGGDGTGTDTACSAIASTSSATCNGNGDGLPYSLVANKDESMRAWQHLANAALIEGQYTGSRTGGLAARTNLPAGPMSNSVYSIGAVVSGGPVNVPVAVSGTNGDGDPTSTRGRFLGFGSIGKAQAGPVNTTIAAGGALSMGDAYNIDMKMDDGQPYSGKLRGGAFMRGGPINAAVLNPDGTSSALLTGPYTLSDTTTRIFIAQYF